MAHKSKTLAERYAEQYGITRMIKELEAFGYKVTPARNEALSWHRVIGDEKKNVARVAFEWEAVHMIAAQLRPGHLHFEEKVQSLERMIFSAKLYL